MNSLKIKLQNCQNFKRKLIISSKYRWNYWEAYIEKVSEFNFLNEETEDFTSRWCQRLVNVTSPSYLKQKKHYLWHISRLYRRLY